MNTTHVRVLALLGFFTLFLSPALTAADTKPVAAACCKDGKCCDDKACTGDCCKSGKCTHDCCKKSA